MVKKVYNTSAFWGTLSPAQRQVNTQWIFFSILIFSFLLEKHFDTADQILICPLIELILMKSSEYTLWFQSHQSKASQMVKKVYNTTAFWGSLSPAQRQVNNQWMFSSLLIFSFLLVKYFDTADQILICPLIELILMKSSEYTLWFQSHQSKASQMVKKVYNTTAFWGSLSPAQRQVNNQWMFSSILIFSFWLEKHSDWGQIKFWYDPSLSISR